MATKNNPGAFDCYANAKPDEPMFVLLARDELAPDITLLWAYIRNGEDAAHINAVINRLQVIADKKPSINAEKFKEAINCAFNMHVWRNNNPNV